MDNLRCLVCDYLYPEGAVCECGLVLKQVETANGRFVFVIAKQERKDNE